MSLSLTSQMLFVNDALLSMFCYEADPCLVELYSVLFSTLPSLVRGLGCLSNCNRGQLFLVETVQGTKRSGEVEVGFDQAGVIK